MTEDAKPGLKLGPNIEDVVKNTKIQEFEVDDTVELNLFQDTGISKLVRHNSDDSIGDDGYVGRFESDDGGLF